MGIDLYTWINKCIMYPLFLFGLADPVVRSPWKQHKIFYVNLETMAAIELSY